MKQSFIALVMIWIKIFSTETVSVLSLVSNAFLSIPLPYKVRNRDGARSTHFPIAKYLDRQDNKTLL